MASLEVHGAIGPTTLRHLCAEQTMANHCKTQFNEQGSDISIDIRVQVLEFRFGNVGTSRQTRQKSGCSGATVDGKYPANPAIMNIDIYPTHWSTFTILNGQRVNIFSINSMQRYVAFMCIYFMCFR